MRVSTRRGMAAGAVVGLLIAFAPVPHVVGWTALMVAAVVLGLVAWRTPEARAALLAGFLLRAASALSHVYLTPLPATGQDAVRFEQEGWNLAAHGLFGAIGQITRAEHVYSWIIGVLYALTDRSPLMIQMLNVLLGTLVVWNVYALARLLWGADAARKAAWAMAVFPTAVLFSAVILRETMVVYPLSLGALLFARWHVTNRFRYLAGAMVSFAVILAFHAFVVPILGMAVVLVVGRWLSPVFRGRRYGRVVPVLAGATIVAVVGGAAMVVWSRIGHLESAAIALFQIHHEITSVERAGYLAGLRVESMGDVVWQAPIRLVFFLLMPFPWLVRAAVDLVGLMDSLLYCGIVWILLRHARRVWRHGPARAVLLLAFGSIGVFSVVVSNYGTAIRHRAKVAPLLIAVAAVAAARPAREPGGVQVARAPEPALP